MDSLVTNSDSFLQSIDLSLGLTFGEKMANLLHSGGIKADDLISPEMIDDIVGDCQEEWSLIIDTLEILHVPEIKTYEELKLKVTEADVDKFLNEKLGNSDNKVCVTEEVVEIASFQFQESRIKFESVQKVISYLKDQVLQCDKKFNLLDKDNQNLVCNKNKIWASFDTKCSQIVIQWNELSQAAHQYLNDEIENDNSSMSKSQLSLLSNEIYLKLLEILESTSQQLAKQFTIGAELATIFTPSRSSEIKIKRLDNNMMEMLDKCQGELEQIVFLQKCIMAEMQKKMLCQNMASEFFKLISLTLLNFTNKFINIQEHNEEASNVEVVNESKLSALNEALNCQSSLLTPENLISALTTLDAKLDDEEAKCTLKVLNVIEKQLVEITAVHKLINQIDLQGDELRQKYIQVEEFESVISCFQKSLDKLISSYSKKEHSDKEKLEKLMVLYFTNHDDFLQIFNEMKWKCEIFSKAVV